MDKKKLIPGRKYLRRRSEPTSHGEVQAERWIKCLEITENGAVFGRDYEKPFHLTDEEIKRELREQY